MARKRRLNRVRRLRDGLIAVYSGYMEKQNFNGVEAAAFLGIHIQTLRKWRKAGKIVPQFEAPNCTIYSGEYLKKIKHKNNLE